MSTDEALSVMVVDDEPGIRTALAREFSASRLARGNCLVRARGIRNVEGRDFDLSSPICACPTAQGWK
jgi:hypothetical protein